MKRAIEYDCTKPISREEWLRKWSELRQRDYPRRPQPDGDTITRASRGKRQVIRCETV